MVLLMHYIKVLKVIRKMMNSGGFYGSKKYLNSWNYSKMYSIIIGVFMTE
jgi:hypothetical protein